MQDSNKRGKAEVDGLRTDRIVVAVSARERERIARAASLRNLPESVWVRSLALTMADEILKEAA